MIIRRLVPADAAAFQQLRLIGLKECPSAFTSSYEEECGISIATIEGQLAPESGRNVFGAFADSVLIGIVGVGREGHLKLKHKAFVRGMYVGQDNRDRGVGKQLMEHAIAFAATMEGVHQVTLAVTVGNEAAIRLYESLGFKAFGHEPDALFVDGVMYDEIQMVHHLGNT